jgi:hypothetical protein
MGQRFSVVVAAFMAVSWAAGSGVLAQERAGGHPGAVEVAPDDVVQELRLEDGSRLYGRVVEVKGDRVVFQTVSGPELVLIRDQVSDVRRVRGHRHEGEFRVEDPNRTRLFFGPTARSLPRGRGYLGVYELLMPFVQVGLTDRLTVGGGTPLIFGDGGDSHPYWVTPKLQLLRGQRTQVAAGVMHILFTGDEEPVGIAYGVVTHGTRDTSVTAGLGYGYESSDRGTWIGMVGGDKRLGRSVKLLAEGYLWQEGEGILMGGVRFFGARLSADLGLVTALGGDDTFVFPVVNVVWTF